MEVEVDFDFVQQLRMYIPSTITYVCSVPVWMTFDKYDSWHLKTVIKCGTQYQEYTKMYVD